MQQEFGKQGPEALLLQHGGPTTRGASIPPTTGSQCSRLPHDGVPRTAPFPRTSGRWLMPYSWECLVKKIDSSCAPASVVGTRCSFLLKIPQTVFVARDDRLTNVSLHAKRQRVSRSLFKYGRGSVRLVVSPTARGWAILNSHCQYQR